MIKILLPITVICGEKFPLRFVLFVKYSTMANDTGTIRCPILSDSYKSWFHIRHKKENRNYGGGWGTSKHNCLVSYLLG